MQANSLGNIPRGVQTKQPAAAPKKPAMPDLSSMGDIPMELFTEEALAACPHARAMFDKIQQMGKMPAPAGAAPASPTASLAEAGSWVEAKSPGSFQATTKPQTEWTSDQEIAQVLSTAAKNVEDNALGGHKKSHFRTFTRERIDHVQRRQLEREDNTEGMHRLIHTKQLFGGEVEVHWNPNLESKIDLFGQSSMGGIVRVSDASNEQNPDGKNMYGLALGLVGNDGQMTDILLTGGGERTEYSQAQDPKAQLGLFNMIDSPNKIGGLAQLAWEVGAVEAGQMILDVGRMKADLNSVSDLRAYSRAPFRLKGKDGNHYLVKMRAKPMTEPAPEAQEKEGQTTSERLVAEFADKASEQDTRWSFDLQFMQPGDDANDGRKTWSGPWVTAGEIVIPKITDQAKADEMAQVAEDAKFNVWKGKESHDRGPDNEVFYPHGWTNQARLWAYGQSAKNRGAKA